MVDKKYQTGLIIGRFQPFHNGHLYLIKEALKYVQKPVVGIGSSNVQNEENPWNFKTRKKMIETVFEREGWKNKLIRIVPIADVPDDDEWLRIIQKEVEKFDVGIGNNQWTNGILEKAGFRVLRLPYFKRHLYEGKRIRELMKEGKHWQDRVPKYLTKSVKMI